jgi:hypothetical protein
MKKLTDKKIGRTLGGQARPKDGWKTPENAIYSKLRSSARWQSTREQVLNSCPLCCFCERPADQVHHIDPKDISRFYDLTNLVSVDKKCHIQLSAKLAAITRKF